MTCICYCHTAQIRLSEKCKCCKSSEISDWTICDKCMLRVSAIGSNPREHNCELIVQIKESLDVALKVIQSWVRSENLAQVNAISLLESRINKLESDHLDQLNPHAFLILKKRIEQLEKSLENYRQYKTDIEDLETEVMYLKERCMALEKCKDKKPYKCPVCDGSGALEFESMEEMNKFKDHINTRDNGKPFIWCSSCEGKGIVWG